MDHALTRTKQRNNSLLDATGKPVSEMAITALLAGLSRDAYATMFSLDDETLEAGGKAILVSRGDLGKLLFTASAGLGHDGETTRLSDKLRNVVQLRGGGNRNRRVSTISNSFWSDPTMPLR
nr:AAA family ATPase [Mesorhizobium loti]